MTVAGSVGVMPRPAGLHRNATAPPETHVGGGTPDRRRRLAMNGGDVEPTSPAKPDAVTDPEVPAAPVDNRSPFGGGQARREHGAQAGNQERDAGTRA